MRCQCHYFYCLLFCRLQTKILVLFFRFFENSWTRLFVPHVLLCWLLPCARLGFMRRKCRRMMAFTSDRLFIVRVDDGKAKASYPLKSVQLAPSDKVNQASDVHKRYM